MILAKYTGHFLFPNYKLIISWAPICTNHDHLPHNVTAQIFKSQWLKVTQSLFPLSMHSPCEGLSCSSGSLFPSWSSFTWRRDFETFLYLLYYEWMKDLWKVWCIIKWSGLPNCSRFMFPLNHKARSPALPCVQKEEVHAVGTYPNDYWNICCYKAKKICNHLKSKCRWRNYVPKCTNDGRQIFKHLERRDT